MQCQSYYCQKSPLVQNDQNQEGDVVKRDNQIGASHFCHPRCVVEPCVHVVGTYFSDIGHCHAYGRYSVGHQNPFLVHYYSSVYLVHRLNLSLLHYRNLVVQCCLVVECRMASFDTYC